MRHSWITGHTTVFCSLRTGHQAHTVTKTDNSLQLGSALAYIVMLNASLHGFDSFTLSDIINLRIPDLYN